MLRFVLTRLLTMVLVLLFVSLGLFGLSHAAPGGPLASMIPVDQLGDSQELIEAKIKEYGLDQPLPVQYARWAGQVLTGDLGTSFQFNRPVASLIAERTGPTLELMGLGLLIGNIIAVTLGVVSATHKGKALDYGLGGAAITIMSIPAFFLGMLMIYVFSAKLGVLPSAQMSTPGDGSVGDLLRHLVLPVSVLALVQVAGMMRYVRAGMLEELTKDYVRTAIAKGATPAQARRKALRNALAPIVTVMMVSLPTLLSGAVVLEAVFAWPGLGSLTIDAIQYRDYPIILGFGLMIALVVVISNFLSDLLLAALDPRVRLS